MCLLKHRCMSACRYALAYGAFGRGLCSVTSNRCRLNAERKCTKSRSASSGTAFTYVKAKDIQMADKLQRCALAFKKLIDIQYEIIIGRKGQISKIILNFSETEFVHLVGLHKLTDNEFFRTASRKKVFDYVLDGKINYDTLTKSESFEFVKERIEYFEFLESMLDSNDIIFKYNSKKQVFSLIQVDYLLQSAHNCRDIYIFLDRIENSDSHFCRSFFPKGDKDYTVGQAKYTLLFKKKINKITGEFEIQYDKLSDK